MRSPAPEYACAHPGKAGRFCAFAMCGPVDARVCGNDGRWRATWFPSFREARPRGSGERESTGSTERGCGPVHAGRG